MSPPSKNKGGVKSESFVSKKKDDKAEQHSDLFHPDQSVSSTFTPGSHGKHQEIKSARKSMNTANLSASFVISMDSA